MVSRPDARTLIETVLDAGLVDSRGTRRPPTRPSRAPPTPRSWPRPGPSPATTRRSSPARACSAGAGSPSWPASSPSWPGRSGWPRPSGSSPRSSGPPAERLPLLAAPASGGTRMQEGALAFVQMVKITAAVQAHRAAGLPYLVYLRHPTTGGVFASWGSLGHVTAAEPGALIGFLGPRVFESLHGYPFPERRAGGREPARARAGRRGGVGRRRAGGRDPGARRAVPPRHAGSRPGPAPEEDLRPVEAWEAITRSRRDDRPGVRTLLKLGRHRRDAAQRHRRGRERARVCCWRWPGSATAPAVVLGQDRRQAAGQRAARARQGCGWPGGACGWPPSWACRWSP